MNGGAPPLCPRCGGLSTNPADVQCRFCGAALHGGHGPAQGHGAPPQPYGAPQGYAPPSFGPQPQAYGPQPQPYAPQPQSYGPQPGYGRPIQQGPFGGGWSSFLWFRLAIAGIAISLSLIGACISAISN